ncbi:MAG: hypothetical protein JWQ81_6418 [Amycolatopsis sp.]|nr:hypothetical protein [Amycolatopsis sp.]
MVRSGSGDRRRGPGVGSHVRPSARTASSRPRHRLVDKVAVASKCPQLRPLPVFIFFFSSRDLRTAVVIGVVDCVDRCRLGCWQAVPTCVQGGWRTGGQFGRPVDEFSPRSIRPQIRPVVPMVVPSLRASCTQVRRPSGVIGIALSSDGRRMWTDWGQPVEPLGTTMWTSCGWAGDGLWSKSHRRLSGGLPPCGATAHRVGKLPCGPTSFSTLSEVVSTCVTISQLYKGSRAAYVGVTASRAEGGYATSRSLREAAWQPRKIAYALATRRRVALLWGRARPPIRIRGPPIRNAVDRTPRRRTGPPGGGRARSEAAL